MRHRPVSEAARRGAAATELALTLPLLALVSLACVDFGRMAFEYVALTNAARVGAEYGATHRLTDRTEALWRAGVLLAVQEEMEQLPNFQPDDLDVEIETATDADGWLIVELHAEYPFQTIVDWPGIPHDTTMRRQLTVRQYR